MRLINPYLSFLDNCEEAFNFYKAAFGGEFASCVRFKDMPQSDFPIPEEEMNKIMHVSLPISEGFSLMGSDTPAAMGGAPSGNNIAISINTDSEEEATDLFNKLSAGGNITMPLGKVFWGAFFGMFTDKFGISWMVSYDYGRQ